MTNKRPQTHQYNWEEYEDDEELEPIFDIPPRGVPSTHSRAETPCSSSSQTLFTNAPPPSSSHSSIKENNFNSNQEEAEVDNNNDKAIYVGDLDSNVNEANLHEHFSSCGNVKSVRLCRDAVSQKSLCYAYVNFQTQEEKYYAMDKCNFSKINGKPCRIMEIFKDLNEQKKKGGNVYIRNLSPTIDSKLLHDTFSMFGRIMSCKVACDNKTGRTLCRGYVQYIAKESANEAVLQFNGKIIRGRPVQVDHYLSKEDRQKYFGEGNNNNSEIINSSLFLRDVPRNCTDQEIEALFSTYGSIKSVYLPCVGSSASSSNSKGFGGKIGWGYVTFETEHEANVSMCFMNGYILRGSQLMVTKSQPKNSSDATEETKCKGRLIYICMRNLDEDVTEVLLENELNRILKKLIVGGSSSISTVCIYKGQRGGNYKSLGQAVIGVKTPQLALELVHILDGQKLFSKMGLAAFLLESTAPPVIANEKNPSNKNNENIDPSGIQQRMIPLPPTPRPKPFFPCIQPAMTPPFFPIITAQPSSTGCGGGFATTAAPPPQIVFSGHQHYPVRTDSFHRHHQNMNNKNNRK